MLDDSPQRPHGVTLVIHSFLPTAIGIIVYFMLGILFVGLHLLGISLSGTAFPVSFDDVLLQGYANFVIQPLATLVNNDFFNSGLTIILWGIAGWVLCATVAGIAGAINDWRNTAQDITIPQEGVVVRHPLQRNLAIRLLWRLFIGILIILYTAAILPAVRYCLGKDMAAMHADSLITSLYLCAINVLIWAVVFHVYVILFRLYVLRTRIFGEILY